MLATEATVPSARVEVAGIWQWECMVCGALTLNNGESVGQECWGSERWDVQIGGVVERDGVRYLTSSGLCPACAADYRTPDHPRLSRRLAMMRQDRVSRLRDVPITPRMERHEALVQEYLREQGEGE
jgi:hypothetical protein